MGRKHALRVVIAVVAVDGMNEPMVYPLDGAARGSNVEPPTCPHCHATNVGAMLRARSHDRPHHVARPKAMHLPRSLWTSAREPILVHPAHLARAVACRPDQQGSLPPQPQDW